MFDESEKNAAPGRCPERRQYIMADRVCLPDTGARQDLAMIT